MPKLFLQDAPNDNGPACLATVLRYFGAYRTPIDLSQEMETTRAGSSDQAICGAAANYGLKARSVTLPIADLDGLTEPVIARVQPPFEGSNHGIVVFPSKEGTHEIGDPGEGSYTTTTAKLQKVYLGKVITFQKTKRFRPGQRSESYPRQFLRFIWTYRASISICLVLGLVTSAIGLGLVVLPKRFVDTVLPRDNTSALWLFIAVYFGARLLFLVSEACNRFFTIAIRNAIERRLGNHYFTHALNLEKPHLDQREKGEFLEQFNQIEQLSEGITNFYSQFVLMALGMVLKGGILIFFYDPALVGTLLLVVTANGLLGLLFTSRTAARSNRRGLILGRLNTAILDGLSDVRVIRIFGATRWIGRRFMFLLSESMNLMKKLVALQAYGRSAADGLNIVSQCFIFIFCGSQIISGNYTTGDFLVFFFFAQGLASESQQFPQLLQSFPTQLRAFARIRGILGLSSEAVGKPVFEKATPEIKIQNLNFGYRQDQTVLEQVSLDIPRGKTTAIVGETGSGKTTLVNLIMGFYKPSSGSIQVNGTDLRAVDLASYRSQLSAVFQDTTLFYASLLQNVTLGNPSLDEYQVAKTARILGVHRFIENLPMGYRQIIYQGALSGGQTQQLGILRATSKTFNLLVMDEATSHLDTATEAALVKGLHQLCGNKVTRIVIAHRLSTVKSADRIVVMKAGRVVETGNHESLTAKKGAYFELVRRQYEVDLAPPPLT